MAAVLDAFASKLAGVLVGMAKEEVEMLLGVPGEITKLEKTLGDLSRILVDAERKRIQSLATEGWVRELKDVMYDADDMLDLYQIMEGGEDPLASTSDPDPKATPRCWSMPAMFFCFRNPVVAHEIGKKIQALNKRLLDIAERSSRFGFITQEINSNKGTNSWSEDRKTGPSFIQSDIVGEKIEESKRKLVDLLVKKVDPRVKGNSNVFVAAAITGTGGIGKTTLARMVFNDTTVVDCFDKVIWLSVNKEVNEIDVMHKTIAAFGGKYDDLAGDKALFEHTLKQSVQQKKFLLVMDDVWSEKVWDNLLRVPLNAGASRSQVLVTTRNEGVARMMKAQYLHRVDKLEVDDAWTLLKKQVVLNVGDEPEIDGLKDIGTKIAERCNGLPLAIKVLGGLLLNISRTRDAWVNVRDHFTWSTRELDDDINKAVYLSYEELPSHLKQCFLLCSLFPKDELIRSGDIIQLWIAQGYVHNKTSSKLPEELGLEYYRELASRNLLEPNKGYYDLSACTMHDVVRSFAQHMAKDEGLLLNEEHHNVNNTLNALKLRHLSISNMEVQCDALQNQASLRTLMLFGSTTVELKDLLNNISRLRVLYLDYVNLDELPDSICHVKHLRLLCLSGTSISTIPQDIGDLKFLQAIDLVGCTNMTRLPNSILKLRKLRFLNFRGTAIGSVPRGFGKLEDLVNIYGFPTHSDDSADDWCSLEELGSLTKLMYLDIRRLEKASSGSMAARAKLSSKCHLTNLDLKFTSRLRDNGEVEDNISKEEHERTEEVLANLCPPTCILGLTVYGYFGRGLPQWMRTMSVLKSLRRLYLEDYACCTQLPNGLGQLPFLDCFWVERAPSVQCIGHDFLLTSLGGGDDDKDVPAVLSGTRIDMRQPDHISPGADVAFPKLTRLGFQGMLGWTEWHWEQHVPAMPILEWLTITDCKLQRLPPGLAHHACRLRKLVLRNILRLDSVEDFPSLVELIVHVNPRIERISNNPSLQLIDVASCPRLQVLQDLPSLRSMEWWDLEAEALPQYLQEAKLNKLRVDCSPRLLKLISLQDESSEWEKIRHVQQLKAYGKEYTEDSVDRHIFYTKEPCSFEAVMGESTD